MIELIIVVAIAVYFAKLADHTNQISHKMTRKRNFCFQCVILVMAVFIGLRTDFNDTEVYRVTYERIMLFPEILNNGFSWKLASNPGYQLTASILKTIGLSTQSYIMFYSLIIIWLYMRFIKRFGCNYPFCIYLFVTTGTYLFAAAGIKQAFATAIAINAISLALEHKWIKYYIVIYFAAMFHAYVLIFAIVPLLMFKPGKFQTWILLLGSVAAAIVLRPIISLLVNSVSSIGDKYSIEELSGEGVNIWRVIVCNVPTVLVILYKDILFKESTKQENLIINMAVVNGAIMIVGLFGTANYFARMANFFLIGQVISIPWIVEKIGKKDRIIIISIAIICYGIFFAYEYAIIRPFSWYFKKISLLEYIDSFFP